MTPTVSTPPVTRTSHFASRVGRAAIWVSLVALCAPLLIYALVGWFSRYAADDYCTASQVALAGFVRAQSNLYVNWSGRFAATLLITLVEVLGVGAVPVLAAAALAAWVAAATWT